MGTVCALAVTGRRTDGAAASLRALRRLERAAGVRAPPHEVRSAQPALRAEPQRRDVGAGGRPAVRLRSSLPFDLRRRDGRSLRPDDSPALVAQGYDRSFELLEPRPPQASDWSPGAAIELDPVDRRARIEHERGSRSRRDRQGLRSRSRARRDAFERGRSSRAPWSTSEATSRSSGAPPEGGPWLVSVESPWRPGKSLGTIRLARRRRRDLGAGASTIRPGRLAPPPDRPGHRRVGRRWAARRHRRRAVIRPTRTRTQRHSQCRKTPPSTCARVRGWGRSSSTALDPPQHAPARSTSCPVPSPSR